MNQTFYPSYPNDRRPIVSHTIVFPTGEKLTYEWKSIHGKETRRYWGRSWLNAVDRNEDTFRVGHCKGVKKKKGRKADSFNRDRKRMDFRNNAKTPCCYPWGGSAKTSAKKQQNREDRRHVRQLIHHERYDEIRTIQPQRDRWRWD